MYIAHYAAALTELVSTVDCLIVIVIGIVIVIVIGIVQEFRKVITTEL